MSHTQFHVTRIRHVLHELVCVILFMWTTMRACVTKDLRHCCCWAGSINRRAINASRENCTLTHYSITGCAHIELPTSKRMNYERFAMLHQKMRRKRKTCSVWIPFYNLYSIFCLTSAFLNRIEVTLRAFYYIFERLEGLPLRHPVDKCFLLVWSAFASVCQVDAPVHCLTYNTIYVCT